MNDLVVIVILTLLFVWMAALTAIGFMTYRKLTKIVFEKKAGSLVQALEKILLQEKDNDRQIIGIKKELLEFKKDSLNHYQKLSVVRFNPFDETGGDNSFSMALLDGTDNGFVITGLHTRERTRLYLKPIAKGKSSYQLSKEEKEAIEKASKRLYK